MSRYDLPDILYASIRALGGQADIISVCKYVWAHYQTELECSGDLFFTWQFDLRWAATELRKAKRMKAAEVSPKGVWEVL